MSWPAREWRNILPTSVYIIVFTACTLLIGEALIPTRWLALLIGAPAEQINLPTLIELPGKGSFPQEDWFREKWEVRRFFAWRHRKYDREAVVFIGDSIIEDWQSLDNFFPKLKIANRGIGGDTTRGVLYRLEGDALILSPKILVLHCGVNDINNGDSAETVLHNIREIILLSRKRHPNLPIVISGVLPRSAEYKNLNQIAKELNKQLQVLVKEHDQVHYIDGWGALADENDNASYKFFYDLIHPNSNGYQELAKNIRVYLED